MMRYDDILTALQRQEMTQWVSGWLSTRGFKDVMKIFRKHGYRFGVGSGATFSSCFAGILCKFFEAQWIGK